MGNNKFKLSDMIPNAWFYKLKHMRRKNTKTNDNNINTNYINQTLKKKLTLSPIITTSTATANPIPRPPIAADPPRRSSKRRSTSSSSSCRRRKPVFKPRSRLSVSNYSSAETSSSESDRSLFDDDPLLRLSSSTADIIIDLEAHDGSVLRTAGNNNNNRRGGGGQLSDGGGVDLPPILTRPINFDDTVFAAAKNSRSRAKATATKTKTTTTTKNWSSPSSSSSSAKALSVKTVGEEKSLSRRKTSQNDSTLVRRSSPSGIRLRANSPRLACARKSLSYARDDSKRCLKESFAVVKSSVDPQRDFRDSMVEMIVENNIRASKDLEELLACYLSLNSKQYHDLIVKAFEQIWFDMAHIRL